MLRELSRDEISFVSGGTDVQDDDDIVVNGRYVPPSILSLEFQRKRTWAETNYGLGEMILDALYNTVGLDYVTTAEALKEAERLISDKFNQTTIVSSRYDSDGNLRATGADGWTYVDTDGNGIFDQRQRPTPSGNGIIFDFGNATRVFGR